MQRLKWFRGGAVGIANDSTSPHGCLYTHIVLESFYLSSGMRRTKPEFISFQLILKLASRIWLPSCSSDISTNGIVEAHFSRLDSNAPMTYCGSRTSNLQPHAPCSLKCASDISNTI